MNFKESWKGLSDYEHGDDHYEQADMGIDIEKNLTEEQSEQEKESVGIFLQMKELANSNETANELFHDILSKTLHYINTVDHHSESRIKKEGVDEVEMSGKSRTRAHNALIDAINIYSRYCSKSHLDNSWRTMLGLDREQITKWALNVAHLVRIELLKK
jgi:hypothetical protein